MCPFCPNCTFCLRNPTAGVFNLNCSLELPWEFGQKKKTSVTGPSFRTFKAETLEVSSRYLYILKHSLGMCGQD